MTAADHLLARLATANPVSARSVEHVATSPWAGGVEEAILDSPRQAPVRAAVRARRRLLPALAAGLVIAAGGGALATISLFEPPTPDLAHAIRSETIAGDRLALAPAVGEPGEVCFVVETARGPRLMGCGPRTPLLSQGAELRSTVGNTMAVWGFAPGGATSVRLGSVRAAVTAKGFYAVRGPRDGELTLFRGAEVVRRTPAR